MILPQNKCYLKSIAKKPFRIKYPAQGIRGELRLLKGDNIALGKPVSAFNNRDDPSVITDGDTATYVRMGAASNYSWAIVDLEGEYEVYSVYWKVGLWTTSYACPARLEVFEGGSWVKIDEHIFAGLETYEKEIEYIGHKISKVRIYGEYCPDYAGAIWAVWDFYEVKVYQANRIYVC